MNALYLKYTQEWQNFQVDSQTDTNYNIATREYHISGKQKYHLSSASSELCCSLGASVVLGVIFGDYWAVTLTVMAGKL